MTEPLSLQEQVERFEAVLREQGGRGLPQECESTRLPALSPGDQVHTDAPKVRQEVETAFTCGCGNLTRAAFPYDGEDDKESECVVCAICDSATLFPRFAVTV